MKKFLSVLLSVLMIATLMPMQVFASEECDHMITAEIWATLPDSVKEANPDKEPNANGNGDVVPAFVNATLPASCETDGWEIRAGDDHGFCFLCGEIIPSDTGASEYVTIPATGHNLTETIAATCTEEGVATCQNKTYIYKPTGSPGNYSPTYEELDCTYTETIEKTPHNMGEWTTIVKPNCTMPGYQERVCLNESGDTLYTERQDLDAIGHTWDEGVVTAPTCTEDGYTTYTCTVCGDTKTDDTVAATDHDWSDWEVTKAASCAEAGIETRVCQNDKAHVETREIPKLEHNFGEVTTVAPTCTLEGYDVQICSVCGHENRFNFVPANGHQLGDDAVVEEAPTCTKDGIEVGTCTVCGERQVRTVIDALGHDWGEWEVVTKPTCTEEGLEVQKCSRCDAENTNVIPALGHDWGEWEVVTEPTCTEEGLKTRVCNNDATHIETEVIPANGHQWDEGVVTAPTCTKGGYTTYTCTVCKEIELRDETAKLGHDPDMTQRTVVKAPTCEADGYDEAPCSRCGIIIRIITPAIGHAWATNIVAPTCETQGYTEYVCQNDSGHNYKTDFQDALGHDWDEGVVTEEADCENTGTILYTCQRNPSHTYIDIIPAKGHEPVSADNAEEPTCTEAGKETDIVCDVCGKTLETGAEIPALGHNYDTDGDGVDDYTVTIAPTCTSVGIETATCTRCQNEITREIPMVAHKFIATRISWPTCTEKGKIIYTCQVCGLIEESFEDPTGHSYDDASGLNCLHGKNCTNIDKNTNIVCGAEDDSRDYSVTFADNVTSAPNGSEASFSVDGYDFDPETDVIASGHEYEWVFHEATCEQDAYWIGTCVRERVLDDGTVVECPEDVENHEIRIDCMNTAFGHRWSLLDDDSCLEPTCTENGVRKYICLNDHSHTYTETIPATSHQYVEDASQYVAPTCNTDGQRVFVCQNVDRNGEACLDSYTVILPATGDHNYTLTSTTPATCTEEGTATYTCQDAGCDASYTVSTTPAKGHQFVEDASQYVAATCTENGQKVYVCVNENNGEICGAAYISVIPATGHNYGKTEVVAPTCTAMGYTKHICTNADCDDYYVNDYTSKVAHVMSVTETVAATCGADGHVTYTCANCDYSYNEVLPATGNHQYDETVTVRPTCTTTGVMTYVCSVCGYRYTEEIPKTGHTAVSADNAVAPTCTTAGHQSDTICEVCHATLETGAKLQPTGHNYGKVVVVAPTCTAGGYTKHICTNTDCDDYYVNEYTSKIDHVMSVTETVAATCGADGYVTYTCANCDYSYSEVLPATGNHRYDETVTVQPTCTTTGVKTYVCSVCGYTYTEEIPKTGHTAISADNAVAPTCTTAGHQSDTICEVCRITLETGAKLQPTGHNYGKVIVVAPTCTAEGYTKHICTNADCDDYYVNEYTSKIDHVMSVTETVAATCGADGHVTYTCANCDYSYSEILPATGNHQYDETVTVQPTCTTTGVMTYVCSGCGYTYTEEIPKTEHTAVSADNGVAPTCSDDGKESDIICSVCETTLETGAVIPATGDHKYTEAVKTPATCTEEGELDHICEECNAAYTTVIPKLSHDYTYVETPATCTAEGKIVATCKNCGDVQTYIIPATGHIYDTQGVYTAPTCTEDGYITYTCVVCKKASVTTTEGKAAGHVYKANVTNPAALNADGTITTACVHCGKASTEAIPAIKNVTLSEKVYVYNGKACRPSVAVYDTNGDKIDKSNYTVSYSSNKAIGKAKVTITFKGDKYTGTIVKTFKIIPKNVGISDISTKSKTIRFTWGKVAKCDGYQIQYSTSKTFKTKKTVTIKSRKTCTKTLTGLKSGKTYYIRVRAYKIVDGKKIYGNWSTATKKCK